MDRADSARDEGKYNEAASLYEDLFNRFPKDTGLLVLRGNMLKDAGRFAEARQMYGAALVCRPNDADVFLQSGHLAKLEGHWEAAVEFYRRSAEIDPDRAGTAEEIKNAESHLSQSTQEVATISSSDAPDVLVSAAGADLIVLRLRRAFRDRPN